MKQESEQEPLLGNAQDESVVTVPDDLPRTHINSVNRGSTNELVKVYQEQSPLLHSVPQVDSRIQQQPSTP